MSTIQKCNRASIREANPFEGLSYAVPQGALMLNLRLLIITQRNVSAGFNLITKLYGAKSLTESLALQAAFWRHQVRALIGGQAEEVSPQSIRVVSETAQPSRRTGPRVAMPKSINTAAELEAIINAELRTLDACNGISVRGITRITDKRRDYNWEPKLINARVSIEDPAECKRVLNDILGALQQKYDLGPVSRARAE